jgi:fucose permease
VSCLVAIAAAGLLVVAGGSGLAVWVGTALFGLGVAPQYATMLTYAEAHLPITGAATAWFVGASSVGGLLLPWVIGQLIDARGPAAMPVAVLLAAVATFAWYLLVERLLHHRRTAAPVLPAAPPGPG